MTGTVVPLRRAARPIPRAHMTALLRDARAANDSPRIRLELADDGGDAPLVAWVRARRGGLLLAMLLVAAFGASWFAAAWVMGAGQ